jgi:hypothetical protein
MPEELTDAGNKKPGTLGNCINAVNRWARAKKSNFKTG